MMEPRKVRAIYCLITLVTFAIAVSPLVIAVYGVRYWEGMHFLQGPLPGFFLPVFVTIVLLAMSMAVSMLVCRRIGIARDGFKKEVLHKAADPGERDLPAAELRLDRETWAALAMACFGLSA